MLCKLSDVKTLLGISQQDTTKDAKITLVIKSVSAQIENYIGYKLGFGTYTDELHNVNSRQLIQLNHFPLRTVSSVTIKDRPIEDYKIIPEYARWGRLYKGDGWSGDYYTRGFTRDIVAGEWEIVVSYTAGYYLPGDTNYVEGADDSLPYDIMSACLNQVVLDWKNEAVQGVKSHHEGNISDTFDDSISGGELSLGVKKILSAYCWYGVA